MRGERSMNSANGPWRCVASLDATANSHFLISVGLLPMLLWSLLGLTATSCFGGSSILLNAGGSIEAMQNVADNYDLRLEFHMHDYAPTVGVNRSFAYLNFFDMQLMAASNGEIEVITPRGAAVRCPTHNRQNFLVRAQLNLADARLDCEVWDVDGSNYAVRTASELTFKAFSVFGGVISPFNESSPALAFLRGSTSLVPLGSKPPVTADVGDYFDWKFDANGNESTGKNIGLVTSAFTFVPTAGQGVVAMPATDNSPAWAPFRPLHAGHPSPLDGSRSFSMSDASSSVYCRWTQLDGPTTAVFDDPNSCTPMVTELVFGPYSFALEVEDAAGSRHRAVLDAGAVAYDEKGVVIYPDERLYTILGPAKVLGGSDSDWYDERQITMAKANWENYEIHGGTWMLESEKDTVNGIPRLGTVYIDQGSRKLHGVGTNLMTVFCGGRPGPAVPIPSGAYINVRTPATRLPVNGYSRIVRSCESETEVTLRDQSIWESASVAFPGVPWGTDHLARYQVGGGTIYRNPDEPSKLFGTGTQFLTQFCGGSAGTVRGLGGTPRIYLVDDEYTTGLVTSCQSDTEVTLTAPISSGAISAPGVAWGWESPNYTLGQWRPSQTSNVNYYDVALAHYALYYRTGWRTARDSARWLADRWNRNPFVFTHGPPREFSFASAILLHVVDKEAVPEEEHEAFWQKMTLYVESPSAKATPSRLSDLRESVSALNVHSLLAMYHPDASKRAARRAALVDRYEKLYGPQQQPQGQYFNQDTSGDASRVVSMNHGSSVVTLHSGASFPANYCGDPATYQEEGTITVTAGSNTVTGALSNFVGATGKRILIRGFMDGIPWSQLSSVQSVQSETLLTLRHPWHGDSGTAVSYRIVSSPESTAPYFPVIALGVVEATAAGAPVVEGLTERGNWYWCTVNSGTQMTLDKPYTGDTSTNTFRRIARGAPGRGSQPFMQGIAAWAFHFAAKALEGHNDEMAGRYRDSGKKIVDYLYSYAARDLGVPYFTDFEPCLPREKVPNVCDDFEVSARRTYAVETNSAFAWRYLSTHDERDLAMGDQWYTAQFANGLFRSRFPGDGSVAGLLLNANWVGNMNLTTKSYGQVFGVGAGHMWPAAREGGVAKPIPRVVTVPFDLSQADGATSGKVTLLLPSGEVKHFLCGASPCEITIDERQGEPVIKKQLLNVGGKVLSEFDQELLIVGPPRQ